jgi:Domain of unknown function (DUF5666)
MPTPSRRGRAALALTALVLVALVGGGPAAAQEREFAGTIESVGAAEIAVVDRSGDRLSFQRDAATQVEGKAGWQALAPGDRVIVKWSLGDGPRRAQRVIVLGSGG